jgi:hypothetical protein
MQPVSETSMQRLLIAPIVVLAITQTRSLAEIPSTQPLYQLNETQIDAYLRQLHKDQPDLRQRVVTLARRNIGQPYKIYLLGEAPFETIDPEPVYCLHHSDCVVFAEHTLAMALSSDWRTFLAMLQRIRYKSGQIGVFTRNHYTEADWNPNNAWLVKDITQELAVRVAGGIRNDARLSNLGGRSGANALTGPAAIPASPLVTFSEQIDRARFFKNRYKLDAAIPVQQWDDCYIPFEHIVWVKSELRDGDVVNFVTGSSKVASVTHVGLVGIGKDGSVNLIHSAAPAVREESIETYIERMTKDAAEKDAAGRGRFRGFKFLRLTDNPWSNLRAIDGPSAPQVWVPKSSPLTWEQYLSTFGTALPLRPGNP